MGTRGTITFSEMGCIAAFRDEKSDRRPYANPAGYNIESYLRGMPTGLRRICDSETLQYLLDDLGDAVQPVITTAFWEHDNDLQGNDSWDDVIKYGAHAIRVECLPINEAVIEWKKEYNFLDALLAVVKDVYTRKSLSKNESIRLTDAERDTLVGSAVSSDAVGECASSFLEINVVVPNT